MNALKIVAFVALGFLGFAGALATVVLLVGLLSAFGGYVFLAAVGFFLLKALVVDAKESFGAVTEEEKPLLENVRRWKPAMRRREFRTLRKYLPDQDLEQFAYMRKTTDPGLTPSKYLELKRDSQLFG